MKTVLVRYFKQIILFLYFRSNPAPSLKILLPCPNARELIDLGRIYSRIGLYKKVKTGVQEFDQFENVDRISPLIPITMIGFFVFKKVTVRGSQFKTYVFLFFVLNIAVKYLVLPWQSFLSASSMRYSLSNVSRCLHIVLT